MKNLPLLFICLLFVVAACDTPVRNANDTALTVPSIIDLAEIGEIQARSATEIEGSYWGIQASTLDPELLEKAAEMGVKWTRLPAAWSEIEKEKGKYDWSETDKAFDAVLAVGITPFVNLDKSNLLYVDSVTFDDPKLAEVYGYSPQPPTATPEAMQAWLNFVEAAISRYKDRIQYWEVWNEPNHRKYWGGPADGQAYGKLANATAKVIKKAQPDASVLVGSTAGINADFSGKFLAELEPGLADIHTYHTYSELPEDRIYQIGKLHKVIAEHYPGLEIWQGECGYPSHSSTTGYRGSSPWGLNIQAKWLLRQAFVDTYFCRATLSNYFKLVDDGDRRLKQERNFLSSTDSILGYPERGGSRVRSVGINEKSLLNNPDHTPKPGYHAYQHLCSILDSRYRVAEVPHEINIEDEGVFYGIGAGYADDAYPSVPLLAHYRTEEGQSLLAWWLPWHAQEYLPEMARVSLEVTGASFKEPVLVDLLHGKVYQIESFSADNLNEKTSFGDLPMADYPLVIMERGDVL